VTNRSKSCLAKGVKAEWPFHNGMTFRKEEVAYIKHGELYWVEITLRDGTKVTPRNEDENIIISWSFGGNPSGVHYTSIKKPVETEEE